MIDLIHVKQCKKEAVIKTVKDIVIAIAVFCGFIVGGVGFCYIIKYCLEVVPTWLQNTGIVIGFLIIYLLIILGLLCLIGIVGIIIYDTYKEHLKKCIERIERIEYDKLIGDLNG